MRPYLAYSVSHWGPHNNISIVDFCQVQCIKVFTSLHAHWFSKRFDFQWIKKYHLLLKESFTLKGKCCNLQSVWLPFVHGKKSFKSACLRCFLSIQWKWKETKKKKKECALYFSSSEAVWYLCMRLDSHGQPFTFIMETMKIGYWSSNYWISHTGLEWHYHKEK